MKSLARVSLALCVVGAVFAGCGGGDDTTTQQPPGWPYPTETSFCDKLAEVVCNDAVVTDCYGSSTESLPDDKTSCQEAYSVSANCNPDNLDYHPDAAEECINQMSTIWADGRVDMTEYEAALASCNKVFFEGLANGSPCSTDTECDTLGGATCVQKTGEAAGHCEETHTVGGGQDCSAASAICADDFYCDPTVSACIARPGVAGECGPEKPCKEDALCAEATSQCVSKTANGQPCTDARQCQGGFCALPVGQTEGTCAGTITLNSTSAYCDPFRG